MIRTRKKKTIVLLATLLLVVAGTIHFRINSTGPHGVRFSKVSTRQPHRIYHRGHYVPVPGGRLLYWFEGKLNRVGLEVDLVGSQEFSFGDDWCVLLGIRGPMAGRYFARVTTSEGTSEFHMRGAWSKLDETEHLLFWSLKPPSSFPVGIELIDKSKDIVLARHEIRKR